MSKFHKKRFAHKVRTGCITCKRRRVKCDEAKPACVRCQRIDIECQGYGFSKAKVYDFIPPQGYHQFEASKLDKILQNESALTLNTTVPMLGTAFQCIGEIRAFDIYLSRTAPMLATYGPQIESTFTTVIPQWSLRSPAIKHITIAVALTQQSGSKSSGAYDLTLVPQAMSHYNKAIHEVISGGPPKVCVLLTAFLAWCIEMMGDNFEAATMHLNGMKTILQDIETRGVNEEEKSTLQLIQTDVKRSLELAEGVLRISQQTPEQESDTHTGEFSLGSIRAARESLAHELDLYARSQRQYDDMCKLRACLQLWLNKIRKWDQMLPLSPNRNALRVFLLLAVSLLPADEAAGFSHSLNSSVVEHALKTVSELRCTRELTDDASKELSETLKLVLVYIIRYYHEADYQEQAASMLSVLSIKDV